MSSLVRLRVHLPTSLEERKWPKYFALCIHSVAWQNSVQIFGCCLLAEFLVGFPHQCYFQHLKLGTSTSIANIMGSLLNGWVLHFQRSSSSHVFTNSETPNQRIFPPIFLESDRSFRLRSKWREKKNAYITVYFNI